MILCTLIYSKSLAKTETSNAGTSELIRYLDLFSQKYKLALKLNTVLSSHNLEFISLAKFIRCASKWCTLTQREQNLEFVNLRCIIYI